MLFFDICKYFLENINNEQKRVMRKANVRPLISLRIACKREKKKKSGQWGDRSP